MNTDILKGRWTQIKGDVKKAFGRLTDDDLIKMEGDLTHAAGVIQERYGITREEAEKRWNEFTSKFADVVSDIKDLAQKAMPHGKTKVLPDNDSDPDRYFPRNARFLPPSGGGKGNCMCRDEKLTGPESLQKIRPNYAFWRSQCGRQKA